MKKSTKEIEKILKVFKNPLSLEKVTNSIDAWYFIPTENPDTPYHIVVGPYFLRDRARYLERDPESNSGVEKAEDCLLLANVVCWDGKGFGVWISAAPIEGIRWLNLNFNSKGNLNIYEASEAQRLNVDLDYYKELLKPFKTALMLMGIDITPDPERM